MAITDYALAIEPEVEELGIRLQAFIVNGLDNIDYSKEQPIRMSDPHRLRAEIVERYGDHYQSALQGFKRVRERCGRSWKRYPPSCQSLADLFERTGRLPTIAPVVDCYNAFSLASGLSLGAHDTRKLAGDVRLALSQGGEPFQALGSQSVQSMPSDEYVYRDAETILCRMEARQAQHSALSTETTSALFIVQGHDAVPFDYICGVTELLKLALSMQSA
ncbi:MAG: phenylalanine--tRNA ligase beta subunit-related protein [Pseudomonadota bacterium]